MTERWLRLFLLGTWLLSWNVLLASERHIEFLEGLRARQYYDYALLYLDQLAAEPTLSPELRTVLPFERAVTLLHSAGSMQNAELQEQQLNEALTLLEAFVQANPDHPKSAQANTKRARILLNQARNLVWQAQSPANSDKAADLQQQARTRIQQARTVFQPTRERRQAAWDAFPKYIDRQTERELYERRREAETALIRVELDLAQCTYQEAQTYARGTPRFGELLTQAWQEFEAVHVKYRSQGGGLDARMWQGKCFEEQNEIQKALGIYNELLSHPGTSHTMQILQNQVRLFRLICLNHDKRKDYALVVTEAEDWLHEHSGGKSRSEIGLGILWQQALAQEKLAEQLAGNDADRERLLRTALSNVRQINRFPGQYKDVSLLKMRDLTLELHGPKALQEPEDFSTAFGLARELVQKIQDKSDALQAAREANDNGQVSKLQQDRQLDLSEARRLLALAMTLADAETPIHDRNQTRYLLAYVNYLFGNNYEAAILGEFVAQHYNSKDSSSVASDCAYLAMAAYLQAYKDSPEDQKSVDLAGMERVANLLTAKWPKSDRADDARFQLGQVYQDCQQPAEAARWYSQVPADSAHYASAQVAAGQAFWAAYLQTIGNENVSRPSAEQLQNWLASAEEHLQNGIARLEAQVQPTTPEGSAPAELISARTSLAQILLNQGSYAQCAEILRRAPFPVVEAVRIAEGTQRPASGSIQSTEFATLVFQLLLRAHVGLHQVDEARSAMQQLEQVAATSGGSQAVTSVYVELGRQLQDELKSLKDQGNTRRLAEVRGAFERFLSDMIQRPGQTFGSLVWIAETYASMAEAAGSDSTQALPYFEKAAAAYAQILRRSEKETGFAPQNARFVIQLRLTHCHRRRGDYQAALDLVGKLIERSPRSLEAHVEAAAILQDWGMNGEGEAWHKLRDAILGCQLAPAKATCWGWSQIALNLQRLIDAKPDNTAQRYAEQLFEARYNSVLCRHAFALAQRTKRQKTEELERARSEILAFVSISENIPESWWAKYDSLYRQVETGLDLPPAPLQKPEAPSGPSMRPIPTSRPSEQITSSAAAKSQVAGKPDEAEDGGMNAGKVLLTLLLLGAGGFGIYYLVRSQQRPRRMSYAKTLPDVLPGVRSSAPRQSRRSREATAGSSPSRKTSRSGPRPGSRPSGRTKRTE